MVTAQPTIITIPTRTYEEIVNQINGMPQLSVEASNILNRIPVINSATSSKISLQRKITKFEASNAKFHQLEENEFWDKANAVGRCALNTTFLMGVPLSIGLIPNVIGQVVGGAMCAAAYTIDGLVSMEYSNDPAFIPPDEDGYDKCFGICFGPCFAAYEATHQVPLRIDLARNDAAAQEAALRQSFENLLQFCLDDGATSALQKDLMANITRLGDLIQEHDGALITPIQAAADHLFDALPLDAKNENEENLSEVEAEPLSRSKLTASALTSAPIFMNALAKTFANVERAKATLNREKASYERVSSELNTFVRYFKGKNPS